MTNTITETLRQDIERVIEALNIAQNAYHVKRSYLHRPEPIHFKARKKFVAIDFGSSGAFLVEKATGELFNIKAYGVPDYNKKKKADLGNIKTVDPITLYTKRWNYLR